MSKWLKKSFCFFNLNWLCSTHSPLAATKRRNSQISEIYWISLKCRITWRGPCLRVETCSEIKGKSKTKVLNLLVDIFATYWIRSRCYGQNSWFFILQISIYYKLETNYLIRNYVLKFRSALSCVRKLKYPQNVVNVKIFLNIAGLSLTTKSVEVPRGL